VAYQSLMNIAILLLVSDPNCTFHSKVNVILREQRRLTPGFQWVLAESLGHGEDCPFVTREVHREPLLLTHFRSSLG